MFVQLTKINGFLKDLKMEGMNMNDIAENLSLATLLRGDSPVKRIDNNRLCTQNRKGAINQRLDFKIH